jgi:Ca2+-binding RTX toxin-like protein
MARIQGTNGNDKMVGTTEDDIFFSTFGADTIEGGAGVDTVTYWASPEGVKVSLGTGRGYGGHAEGDVFVSVENLFGSEYRDILIGNNDANRIDGNGGDDHILGGGGNDVLYGNSGNDTLSGGSSSDTFMFAVATYGGTSSDVITDFEVGVDVLHFDRFGWQAASMNDLVLSQVGSDTVISYPYGQSLTLSGVNLNQLMASASHDFLFT